METKKNTQVRRLSEPKEMPTMDSTVAGVFSFGGMIFYRLVKDYSGFSFRITSNGSSNPLISR